MNCIKLLRPLQYQYLFSVQRAKYISKVPQKFLEVEERWKQKDGMSNRWDLIYKAPMDKSLNFVSTYLTASTTALVCASAYYGAFVFDTNTMNDPIIIGEDVVIANNVMESLIYVGAFILFHVAIKIVLSKYVIRLYKDGDNYVAIFRGHWHDQIKKHKFHLDQFVKLRPTFVVSWGDARYDLGKKHGILLDNYFKSPEYLNNLLYKKRAQNDEIEE